MNRIFAIGGFSSKESETIAATYIRELTGKQNPKICLLASPAGDPQAMIKGFEARFQALGFVPSNISFFGKKTDNSVDPNFAGSHFLEQDAIFVSGGNPRCAMALWREWDIASALRNAWENGVLLSGMSAGAVCWFDNHVSLSPHAADRVPLLGFLRGTCVVHYGDRREHARSAMRSLQLPSVVAIEDDVGLLYEDEQLARVIAWRADAGAYRLAWASDEIEARALLPRIAIDS